MLSLLPHTNGFYFSLLGFKLAKTMISLCLTTLDHTTGWALPEASVIMKCLLFHLLHFPLPANSLIVTASVIVFWTHLQRHLGYMPLLMSPSSNTII